MTSNITKLHPSQKVAPIQKHMGLFSEAFPAAATDAGAVGFVLAQTASSDRPLLWVQDRLSLKETGRPYLPGLTQKAIVHVTVNRPIDVLWAMEEGLRCEALSCVIGDIWGDPPALTFMATKRLAMRAEMYKLPCWLIRRAGSPDLSAARDRWRIASVPSLSHPHDPHSPGVPRWQVELFRSRSCQPGRWVAHYDRAEDRIHFTAPFRDGAVAAPNGTSEQHAAR